MYSLQPIDLWFFEFAIISLVNFVDVTLDLIDLKLRSIL